MSTEVANVIADALQLIMKRQSCWVEFLGNNTDNNTDNSEQDESSSLGLSWFLVSQNDKSLSQWH